MPATNAIAHSAFASRRTAAMDIVEIHTALCVGANFIPIPVVDSLAVSAVQLKMIAALARYYGADFNVERGRAMLAAIAIGVAQEAVRRTSHAAAVRAWIVQIPLIGIPLRKLGWPAILAAYTYYLGKSYVDHFESGGQFADFKPPGLLNSPVASALLSPNAGAR
jgi:uncharacterized protein (DUF697 family)